MSLEKLMLELLNNNCVNPQEEGYFEHQIELHCSTVTIIAKPLERNAEGLPTAYDIKSVSWRDS